MTASLFAASAQQRPVTIEDCIQMVRIQQTYDASDPTVVFSPDGRWFIAVIWRGNLSTNLNDYTLLLFDSERLEKPPKELLNVGFGYEEHDQHARPVTQFAFLTGHRLAALATLSGEPRQVIAIDLQTTAVTYLTKHPGGVLAFGTTPDGRSLVYAAPSKPDDSKKSGLYRNGFSLEDRGAIDVGRLPLISSGNWFKQSTEYFLLSTPESQPRKIGDGPPIGVGLRPPHIWMSPDGRNAAAVFPANTGERRSLGLIDISTGKTEPLFLSDVPSSGRVLWARDSQSFSFFSPSFSAPHDIYDIRLSNRRVTKVTVGQEWQPLGWTASGDELILTRAPYTSGSNLRQPLAKLRRSPNGWESPTVITTVDSKFDLNGRYSLGTNGHLIIGVKDDLSEPPELAAYEIGSKRTRVLTRLNPQLSNLKLGQVTRIWWTGPYDKGTSFGYLIKPVGYLPGKKYPLIIQLKDEPYDPDDRSFILDGQEQLSGAAIQVWANAGFMVLFTPAPLSLESATGTKEEEHITAHIESGLEMLQSQGLIDRRTVALTGWSRAGWWSEAVVTYAKTRFAAATNIDNISYNLNQYILSYPDGQNHRIRYWGGVLPWGPTAETWRSHAIDFKYDRAQTPRLIEMHGIGYGGVVGAAELYAVLKTVKVPVEFYLYPDAPHSLKSPVHRLHSLATHTDWFRFWLQGFEDPASEKKAQYARWRKMRQEWEAAKLEAQKNPKKK